MKYLNAINKIPGIGSHRLILLLNYFKNSEAIWKADLAHLKASGLGEKTAQKMFFAKKDIHPELEWEKLKAAHIHLISLKDSHYPSLLKEIFHPPYILYYRGHLDIFQLPSIAIVGARKCTSYGSQIAQKLAQELVQSGVIVVSGMALGIDSFAHFGALEKQGKTIAVLGNGLDDTSIAPRTNFNLSRQIIEKGALLSEYPLETSASPLTFPARNRIIAGLTQGTIVIEAGIKSGALITAKMALEYNREVFAIPGSIFSPQSLGTNNLIRQGAKLVTSLKDILEELKFTQKFSLKKSPLKKPTNQTEETILKTISNEPIHIDKIAKLVKLQTADINAILSLMEIKGWIKNVGGQNYIQL